jgi:uncharacterized protein (UPF0218 family)
MSNDIENRIGDMVTNAMKDNLSGTNQNWPFLDIQDYKTKTGKRFRMTREQKQAGLTREQAFAQFMDELMTKS